MNNYEVNVYLEGNPPTYCVNKKGNTAAIYVTAYTEEEAIEKYKKFMK